MSTLIRGLGRLFLFLALGATDARLWAQPPLTTIRDTVYRADGRPFNGLVLIEWKTFQASNNANIGSQGTTVSVVNGNLYVRLTPTTAATNAYYLVRYNSNGQFQFSEIWSVPSSSAALRLRDIRATLLPGGILTGGGNGGVVVGDTGGGVPGFGDSETPIGAINGVNDTFILTTAPSPAASLVLFRNGLLQTAGNDYTLSGTTITFNPWAVPQFDDTLNAYYRTPASSGTGSTHSLLSTTHLDTTPAAPTRGGLIVGQGTNPTWTQLPLGQNGRCLTSNGTDASWNACLYTGFAPGALPFTDSNGNLSQNSTTLVFNSLLRKFSIGNNTPRATLNVHDATTSGITELTVRGGIGQGSVPLQTWISNAGQSLAFLNADGGFNAKRLLANSSTTRPGYSDAGTTNDPTPGLLTDGDAWYNSNTKARKTFESGQTHSVEQVACSNTGTLTSSTAFTELGSCALPSGYLFAGDRLQIDATFLHTGGLSGGQIDLLAGTVTLAGRAFPAGDDVFTLSLTLGLGPVSAAWSAQSVGLASGSNYSLGQTAFTPGGSFGPLQLRARQVSAGTDSIRLINFTVRRIPQQDNP